MIVKLLVRYFFTIKDLKFRQILYRAYGYIWRPKFKRIKSHEHDFATPNKRVDFVPKSTIIGDRIIILGKHLQLNDFFDPQTYSSFLPLEQFTLHYMDFLLDSTFDVKTVRDFAEYYENHPDLPYAYAPYAVSMRLINWLKASHHASFDSFIINHIEKLGQFLRRNKEFHLLGNHLLKNIKSLIFYHIYFRHDQKFLNSELRLLEAQLNEQIHPDGWHFERTPTYQLVVLEDLLDIYNILPRSVASNTADILKETIKRMLEATFYWEEEYPLMNDSSYWSAPRPSTIHRYAQSLGFDLHVPQAALAHYPDAGYFAFLRPEFTLWIDAGDLGPGYLAGHAHNDSLSFLLYEHNSVLFGDTGACSYQDPSLRNSARSVKSHNTVMIENIEPSEFWGSFRYARKIKLISREISINKLRAAVSYRNRRHERIWEINNNTITITDEVSGKYATAFFHIAPGLNVSLDTDSKRAIIRRGERIVAEVKSDNKFSVSESICCHNINDIQRRPLLSVEFSKEHCTEICVL
jgi:hypothetical protein